MRIQDEPSRKKKRITKDNQQDTYGNVQVEKHGQKRTDVSYMTYSPYVVQNAQQAYNKKLK